MRAVDDVAGANGNGREEIAGRAVGVARGGVIEQVQTAAGIRLSEAGELIQFLLHLLPGEVQRLVLDDIRIDQLFIRHQVSAVVGDLERSERALRMRMAGAIFSGGLARCGWIFIHDVYLHLFQQGGIAVREADLEIVGIVQVLVHRPAGSVPNIVLLVADTFAVNPGLSPAANAEVDQRRVVANGLGLLAWLEHADRYRSARSEAGAWASRGVDDL